jgi:hypothetical protein
MRLFKRRFNLDYNYLISKLERGDSNEIREMLWQPKNETINYLPNTLELIRKLKTDNLTQVRLTIHKQIHKGRFVLLIFNTSGSMDNLDFSPLLLDKDTCKIVGIMLLFNELYGHFTKKEDKEILKLSVIWTKFIFKTKI